MVFLKDVKFDHLQALVDYMYRGEVNVSQDQLAAFLNTAEALKIKGLADGDRDRKNEKRILDKAAAARSASPATASRPPQKRLRKQSKEDSPSNDKTQQLPQHQLPSLARIPPVNNSSTNSAAAAAAAAAPTSNDSPAPSPSESDPPDDDMLSNSAADNLNVEIDDGDEDYSIVEPKVETELEADYSGDEEEDWSDSEYPSRNDASQGID